MAPRIGVVIVNWNGAEFLEPCLRSLQSQEPPPSRILVVDNGSTDGSLELLARRFPAVEVLRNTVNNYAGANNLGVQRADTGFVLQLNTDTELEPGCLLALEQALAARRDAAGAMPKILYPDGLLYSTGVLEREDLYWVDRDQGAPDDGRADRAQDLFGISGCCALWRREAWLDAGGLDEDFHMYYEDVDFSLRMRARGHALLYVPSARVRHVGHGSIKKASKGKDELGERNRLLVLAAHYRQAFAARCVRSPWFQSAAPAELRALLPQLARRAAARDDGVRDDGVRDDAGGSSSDPAMLLDLLLELREAVRELSGEQDAAYGTHRNYPRILAERESWIAMLLREVARLRLWRLPGKRLKPKERDFLRRFEARGGGGS